LSGSGTVASPYTATAAGFTTFGSFGVTNNSNGGRIDVGSAPGGLNAETAAAYQVTVYPNPVYENLKISLNKLAAGATLQLYNVNGSLVRSVILTGHAQNISVKGLTGGVYYIVVRNGEQTTTRKVVIQ
jgi:hypothetical protein